MLWKSDRLRGYVGMKSTVYMWQIEFVHESKNPGSELHSR
jgi:hypothetical protein